MPCGGTDKLEHGTVEVNCVVAASPPSESLSRNPHGTLPASPGGVVGVAPTAFTNASQRSSREGSWFLN